MQDNLRYRPVDALVGNSQAIHRISDQLAKAALTNVPVLITGESGTGKELAARLLHDLSTRRSYSFLKVNCPAIPTHLFENEFFGHESVTDPGAPELRAGKCEQADKGTLFMDEIGELDPTLQPKLLYALPDFRMTCTGATEEQAMDIRLICATNRNLEVDVASGKFRSDLFYRINVVRIHMPPLRDHLSDLPLLINHFLKRYGALFGVVQRPLSSSYLRALQSYRWPGNVRELENLAKRYVVMGIEEPLFRVSSESEERRSFTPEDLDITTPLRVQTKRAIQQLERNIILNVLQAHQWNRKKTARSLDVSYRVLLSKIKEGNLQSVRSTTTSRKDVSTALLEESQSVGSMK
jgi:two-component system, NtrC family, response regulator AtoC